MPNRTLTVLFSGTLINLFTICGAQAAPSKSCEYDRARLLALDENQFDQDMAGGWRALASTPGCTLVAADLLHDYQEAHGKDSGTLLWHEAQMRAKAGQYPQAITLMNRSYKPAEVDKAGWNLYVDATIAFLRKDRLAFEQAKEKLAAVEVPAGVGLPPVINGYIELELTDGSKYKSRWPLNIEVVEGLENCFDKPYSEAYADEYCQSGR